MPAQLLLALVEKNEGVKIRGGLSLYVYISALGCTEAGSSQDWLSLEKPCFSQPSLPTQPRCSERLLSPEKWTEYMKVPGSLLSHSPPFQEWSVQGLCQTG